MDEWFTDSLRDHDDDYGGDNIISNSRLIKYFYFRQKLNFDNDLTIFHKNYLTRGWILLSHCFCEADLKHPQLQLICYIHGKESNRAATRMKWMMSQSFHSQRHVSLWKQRLQHRLPLTDRSQRSALSTRFENCPLWYWSRLHPSHWPVELTRQRKTLVQWTKNRD